MAIRVKKTSLLHFEGVLLTKKFAELEKNLKINMTKSNHNHIMIEGSLSLNISLWIILADTLDVFNKIDTYYNFSIAEQKVFHM